MTRRVTVRVRRVASSLSVLSLLLGAPAARAEITDHTVGTSPPPSRLLSGFAALDRPVGIAEVNVGVLTLPGAEVCAERSSGCSQGDLSFALEAWELYRANLRFGFGAGVMVGLIPTAKPKQDPEGIQRDHSRSYMTFEGVIRYYPFVGRHFEGWVGVVGGLAVVNDRFTIPDEEDNRALLGTRGVTIASEGASLGLAIGMAYELAEHWSLIGSLRVTEWFLPKVPETDPLGSEASLTGINLASALALGVAYRLPL
jgi:hypothetical protein